MEPSFKAKERKGAGEPSWMETDTTDETLVPQYVGFCGIWCLYTAEVPSSSFGTLRKLLNRLDLQS
jgi:hypothetical protein